MMIDYIENGISKWKIILSCKIRNAPKEKKRYIENNMNTQARVNRSTYQKTADSYQVFNYHRDEVLNDNGQLDMKNHSTT